MNTNRIAVWSQPATPREILRALERARSGLAVAMAAETKKTPPARWELYFETEERMRRCLRRLRGRPAEVVERAHLWSGLVADLQLISRLFQEDRPPPAAFQLCRQVQGIVDAMERMLQPDD